MGLCVTMKKLKHDCNKTEHDCTTIELLLNLKRLWTLRGASDNPMDFRYSAGWTFLVPPWPDPPSAGAKFHPAQASVFVGWCFNVVSQREGWAQSSNMISPNQEM